MARVFVTQVPARLEGGVWVPTVSIAAAQEFGQIIEMLPKGMNFIDAKRVCKELKQQLEFFDFKKDFLLPMGDPLVMAAACSILGSKAIGRCMCEDGIVSESFKTLRWDRVARRYFPLEIFPHD